MEKVNFKLDLEILTHDKVKEHPFVNISINGSPQFGEILDKSTTVEIEIDLQDDTENFLSIEYLNKDPKIDVILGEDNLPIKDKSITIKDLYINDIMIDFVALNSEYLYYDSIDPQGISAKGFEATKLSWNGRTTLKFTTPVYIWLLENL